MTADEPDDGTASRDLRTRVVELVLVATEEQLDAPPPATPEWDGDARTELVVMPIFTARPDPLVE